MNQPAPLSSSDPVIIEIMQRLVRMESRIVRLMLHSGMKRADVELRAARQPLYPNEEQYSKD